MVTDPLIPLGENPRTPKAWLEGLVGTMGGYGVAKNPKATPDLLRKGVKRRGNLVLRGALEVLHPALPEDLVLKAIQEGNDRAYAHPNFRGEALEVALKRRKANPTPSWLPANPNLPLEEALGLLRAWVRGNEYLDSFALLVLSWRPEGESLSPRELGIDITPALLDVETRIHLLESPYLPKDLRGEVALSLLGERPWWVWHLPWALRHLPPSRLEETLAPLKKSRNQEIRAFLELKDLPIDDLASALAEGGLDKKEGLFLYRLRLEVLGDRGREALLRGKHTQGYLLADPDLTLDWVLSLEEDLLETYLEKGHPLGAWLKAA